MFGSWIKSSGFKRVHQNDDAEAEEQLLSKRKHFTRQSTSEKTRCLLSAISGALIGVCGAIVCFLWLSPSSHPFEKNAALKQTSHWSKVLDEVEIPMYTARMNGTLFTPPNPSFARQEPSFENDMEWEPFENIRTHVVTREEIIKLGKNPDTVGYFDDEYWGFGPNAYMAQLDIFHQIHCLNKLRKAAFATYPGYSPIGMENPPYTKMWWVHLSHCADMLLQNVKCYGNTDMITVNWVGNEGQIWPDFSIDHKCRDFDTILKWNLENAVDGQKFARMPIPKGAYIWPKPWKNDEDSEIGYPLGKNFWKQGHECK